MPSVAEILIRSRDQYSQLTDKAKRDIVDLGKTTRASMAQAKDSADVLKDTLGVQLPRELVKLIAHSKVLGPALAASFNVVAIAGFVAAAQQLPELFEKISASVTGWDEAAKKAYSNFLDENQKAIKSAEDFRLKMIEIEKGTAAALDAKVKDLQKAAADLQRAATAAANESTKATLGDQILRASTFGLFGGNRGLSDEAKRLQGLSNEAAKAVTTAQKEQAENAAKELKKANQDAIKAASDLEEAKQRLADMTFDMQMGHLAVLQKEADDAARANADLETKKQTLEDLTFDMAMGHLKVLAQEEADLEEAKQRMQDLTFDMAMGHQKVLADEQREQVKKMQEEFKDAFDSVKQTANRAFLDIFQNIHNGFRGLADVIKGIFRTLASEILSTMTAQLFTPLIMNLSKALGGGASVAGMAGGAGGALGFAGLGGGLAGLFAGGGSASAAHAASLSSAYGFGGGGTPTALGAFATNPFTIGAAAAIVGAIAWSKSQAHHEASSFVDKFQNPFGGALAEIVDSFNAAKNSGKLTTESANSMFGQVQALFRQFNQGASDFAARGSDEALVVRQAHQTLDPLIEQILKDMQAAIETIPGVKTPRTPPQPAIITFQLDRKTMGRLMLEDINTLIRGQGFILQPAR